MDAYICDGVRTPIGRFGGVLSTVRADDLAAIPIRALVERNPNIKWGEIDDVLFGCANQAGEDNRNVARMAVLLSGLPVEVPAGTLNRLCGSGLDAVATAARMIRSGDADLVVAGGVESMSRAPYVMGKATAPFARDQRIEDTTIGWRFVNPAMAAMYGTDAMPQTAQNVADEYGVSREDQDAFAFRSQSRAARAQANGRFEQEIVAVSIARRKGEPVLVSRDEHPRETSLEALAGLRSIVRPDGSVTAGNSSGVNDGSAAMIIASAAAVERFGLTPKARIVSASVSGVAPRIMGIGPITSTQKLLSRNGLSIEEIDVIELNEAFAAQALAVTRALGLEDDAEHVNPNGGAISLGHPLGMSGARLALSAAIELQNRGAKNAIATMCMGVGQGLSLLLEGIH